MSGARVVPASDGAVARAAGILRAGGLVAFPTETVYGLGADATDDAAVAGIFAAKDRPEFNPLIVHFESAEAAARVVTKTALAAELAERFWPGPLTLVLERATDCPLSLLVSAGLDTVAVRVPALPLARQLIAACGRPLAAPSANPAGGLSPTSAAHVAASLGDRVDLILDGGPCPVGIESTIVDARGDKPVLLRPGGLAVEEIAAACGPLDSPGDDSPTAPSSPGRLASHYAPRLPLRLKAMEPLPGEALLAIGAFVPAGYLEKRNLSPSDDLVEAAANLFAMLRALDRPEEFSAIAVMPIPETGLGLAINDRLRHAAAPRE